MLLPSLSIVLGRLFPKMIRQTKATIRSSVLPMFRRKAKGNMSQSPHQGESGVTGPLVMSVRVMIQAAIAVAASRVRAQ